MLTRLRASAAAVALTLLIAACITLLYSPGAAAASDPTPALTAAGGAGWDVFVSNGPLWGGILIAFIALQTFLSRQHWLAQGRLLAALTGAALVGSAVVNWHFAGAPSAGIMTAAVAAIALIWHPTVGGTTTRPTGGTLALLLIVVGLAGGSTLTACGGAQTVTETPQRTVDCAKLDVTAIASLAGKLALSVTAYVVASVPVDWDAIEAQAEVVGFAVGGCALGPLVAARGPGSGAAPPAHASAAAPPSNDAARAWAAFARLKQRAGVATFQTSAGPL